MEQKKLREEFELLRGKMIRLGMKFGLDHVKVIELSQKVDKLHNELYQMQKKE